MKNSACIIGHRIICDTPELRDRIEAVTEQLIQEGTVNFLFGDHSQFNTICYEIITKQKKKHPQIKRILFRKDHPELDNYSRPFFTDGYEDSVCPKEAARAGKGSYLQRNYAMIRESELCLFYFSPIQSEAGKSGTRRAYEYALKAGKKIVDFAE